MKNRPVEHRLTKEEVISVISAFDEGWKAKNQEKVDSVLSGQYLYFTPSGHPFVRDSIVATASSPFYQLDYAERIIFDIKIEGNTAVVNTRWLGRGVYRNNNFDDNQRCSITIVKNNTGVKILSEHCTNIGN